jgi:2-succinyl-5-enolpyruvyl-6-hydroxy-3-cyclohexene-1-carboxylate synthase
MIEPSEGDVALVAVTMLLNALVDGGVRHMCMTPGSRSTPIALAAARHPHITLHVHVDERSSAFFGLGIAAATGQPVAMFCTSGTAAANHLPAVVEASLSRVPIIVMTADRPPELHGVGANQTIDQQNLFGGFVKWFCDTGVPVYAPHELHRWWSIGQRAIQHAIQFQPPGPVHLNLPFREPLMPRGEQLDAPSEMYLDYTTHLPAPDQMPAFLREVSTGHRVVVVAGRLRLPPDGVIEACAERGWPLLAEPQSGLRSGSLSAGALLAADSGFREQYHPDLVIQLGAAPTSRGMQELVRSADRLLIVDPDHLVADPDRRSALTINNDPSDVAAALRASTSTLPATRPHWADEWRDADRRVRHAVDTLLDSWDELFEGRVARDLAAAIPDGGVLFAGSSMPIRDLDMYMQPRDGVRVMANRGASGIDGLVSTAFGIAEVSGPTYALLGDLSMLHDASGLLWGTKRCPGAVIVVIDNDGGGIFSMLPPASLPREEFELLFGTPHGLDLEAIARAAGAGVRTVDSARVLVPAIREAAANGGVQLVRVRVDRARAVELRRAVSQAVAAALAG